jgi:N utilization substance protein B
MPGRRGNGPRRAAREAALQVLYLCEVGGADSEVALEAYFSEHQPDADAAQRAFTADIVRGTRASEAELDTLIGAHLAHWRLERLARLDRLILRIAAWELQNRPDTPAAVVLDEAIELARSFGSDDSPAFVNGVLDGVRKSLVQRS